MRNYLDLLSKIVHHGDPRVDRTGVGTKALFSEMLEWDLSDGFPIVTTKKVNFDLIKAELLWFLSGSSDVRDLQKLGCNIWNANADAPYWKPKARYEGDLGRVYGVQWRRWRAANTEVDQFQHLLTALRDNKADRRMVVTAWNPGELGEMALPPCHMFFQCFVRGDQTLDLTMYQRSCDMFLGVPFNISSYALLLHMLAQVSGLTPGKLKILFGDVHIYNNHHDQVIEQLARTPKRLPCLWLKPGGFNLFDFCMEDILLVGYDSAPAIKAKMAV